MEAHDRGEASLAELAARFGVSRGWAWRISASRKRSGSVERPCYRPGPRSRLDAQLLARLVAEHADWTLAQFGAALEKQTGVRFSAACLWLHLKQMGSGLKKSLHASERDTEENRKRRAAFLEKLRAISPERLIYLDESGVTTSMTRLRARRRDGLRIHEASPGGHWKILTVLGALSTRSILAAMTVEEPTDRDIFLAFLDQVLRPKLRPGDVVILDNLSAHKVDGVCAKIEAAGAAALYLPPYSPDLNPHRKSLVQAQNAAAFRQSPP